MDFQSSFNPNIPIYIQIMNDIKKQITAQTLTSGDKLPSVRELAESIQVNPNTIARAYQELERAGITETRRGMGTFIADIKEKTDSFKSEISRELVGNFIRDMRLAGFSDEEIICLIREYIQHTKETAV